METKRYSIKFYGLLGDKFGTSPIEIYAKNVKDVFSGLSSRFGDTFKSIILEGSWHITLGARSGETLTEKDNFLPENMVEMPIEEEELHIFPAITGAGGKGVGQIILGVVLIVVAVVIAVYTGGAGAGAIGVLTSGGTATSIALAGVLSIAGGIMSMMTKSPSMGDYASTAGTDPRLSFIFNGAVNNTEQGVPVPLVYGTHLTGTTIISAGMDVEQI